MNVVLDTNVLLSGLMYPNGTPGRILGAWQENRFQLATCEAQLAGIARVLLYPKIAKVLAWGELEVQAFLKQLYLRCTVVPIVGVFVANPPKDLADLPLLQCATAGQADALVSGDQHLLSLVSVYPWIVSPASFAERL